MNKKTMADTEMRGHRAQQSRRAGNAAGPGVAAMKTFMMLGWRNLWRQKRRSLVVISSIMLGILLILLLIGIINGMTAQMLDNNISTRLGHIEISKKGFFDNLMLQSNF